MSVLCLETITREKPQHCKALEAFQSWVCHSRGKRSRGRWQLATKMFPIFTWHSELNASDVSQHGTKSKTRFAAFKTTFGGWKGLEWTGVHSNRWQYLPREFQQRNQRLHEKKDLMCQPRISQSSVVQGLKKTMLVGNAISQDGNISKREARDSMGRVALGRCLSLMTAAVAQMGTSPGGKSEVPLSIDHGQGEDLFPPQGMNLVLGGCTPEQRRGMKAGCRMDLVLVQEYFL